MPSERVLVNFFYAHPVGHAVEALYYAHGHHAADPSRELAVALNAATPVALAALCPFVSAAYAVEHPLLEPCADSATRLAAVPRQWDWVLDDSRRHQDWQTATFPGMRDYYAASDRHLVAARGRSIAGAARAGYLPHQPLRFDLPEPSLRLDGGARWIAVMPAGSSERALYPSLTSWQLILDALLEAFGDIRFALIGKRRRDGRTTTAFAEAELAALRAHPSRPVDAFDLDLVEQLALIEACELFLSPHTGFGLAALATGTPWLTLSGGRWFEYFFNHVPFRSILPDVERYPCFSQFAPAAIEDDGDDGPRTPSMSRARFADDLGAIVTAAGELLDGSVTYEQALRDYFPALVAAHGGDASQIWSIDGVHLGYV